MISSFEVITNVSNDFYFFFQIKFKVININTKRRFFFYCYCEPNNKLKEIYYPASKRATKR